MNYKSNNLIKDILYEQSQIEIVIGDIKRLNKMEDEDVSRDQKTAMAGYLMNFYNGVENIVKRVSKEYYGKIPKGELWHKELLRQSGKPPKAKVPLFSRDVIDSLYDYLAFRHFFVHGYGFKINWDKIKMLVTNVETLWEKIKKDLDDFSMRIG